MSCGVQKWEKGLINDLVDGRMTLNLRVVPICMQNVH